METVSKMSANGRNHMPVRNFFLTFIVLCQVVACSPDEVDSRVSGVYGSIVDQNGVPIDNMKILVFGEWGEGNKSHDGPLLLSEAYTDKLGFYDVNLEVPRDFGMLHVVTSSKDPLGKEYDGRFIPMSEDSVRDVLLSYAKIGEKTRIDFKLKQD